MKSEIREVKVEVRAKFFLVSVHVGLELATGVRKMVHF